MRSGGATPAGLRPLAVEGLFQAVAQSLVESWLSAYALLLGASSMALGLIPALPVAATAGAQAFAHYLAARTRRPRRFLADCWIVQGLGCAALGSCVLLPQWVAVPALAAFAVLAFTAGGICVPTWTALVARRARGRHLDRFFATRGQAQQLGVILAILGGGLALTGFRQAGLEGVGFVAVFVSAGLMRLAGSALLLAVPAEPTAPASRPERLPPLSELRRTPTLRRLALHLWFMHLASNVAVPFFVPYMIAELRMSYVAIGLLLAMPAAIKFATLRTWARVADRVGPGPMLRTAGLFLPLASGLWLLPSFWAIVAAQVLGGLAWGAFELAQASSLLRTTRARESAIALFGVVDGGAILVGSLAGGLLAEVAPLLGLSAFLTPIAVSSLLRAAPAVLILWRVRGIGRPAWSHLRMPLRLWSVRPMKGPSLRPWGRPPAAPPLQGSPPVEPSD